MRGALISIWAVRDEGDCDYGGGDGVPNATDPSVSAYRIPDFQLDSMGVPYLALLLALIYCNNALIAHTSFRNV